MTIIDTNGTSAAHAPSAAHLQHPTDDDKKQPAAVVDSEAIVRYAAGLSKTIARVAAYAVNAGDEDTLATLALVREGITKALGNLAPLPALLVDVSAAVERGKRPRGGDFVVGSIVRIKPTHRAAFAGTLPADALVADHEAVHITPDHVTIRVKDGDSYTKIPLKRSQVALARDAAFEAGEIVRIGQKHTAKVAAQYGIDAGALSDLAVASCNGDRVTLRATVDGGSVMLPNVRASLVERC